MGENMTAMNMCKNCGCDMDLSNSKTCPICPGLSESAERGGRLYGRKAIFDARDFGVMPIHGSYSMDNKLNSIKWVISQVLNDMPAKRDWLNPEYEAEMRLFISS